MKGDVGLWFVSVTTRLFGYLKFSCDSWAPWNAFSSTSQRVQTCLICPRKKYVSSFSYWMEHFTFPIPGISTIIHLCIDFLTRTRAGFQRTDKYLVFGCHISVYDCLPMQNPIWYQFQGIFVQSFKEWYYKDKLSWWFICHLFYVFIKNRRMKIVLFLSLIFFFFYLWNGGFFIIFDLFMKKSC